MVRYLLQLGADVNTETNVCEYKYIFIILKLIFFVNFFKIMFTPLHSAAQQGHVMIVKLLLEHGASPNKTNKVISYNSKFSIKFKLISSSME